MLHYRTLAVAAAALALCTLTTVGRAADAPASPYFQVDLSKFITHTLYEPQMKTPGCDLSNLAGAAAANATPQKKLNGVLFRLDGIILVGPGETTSGSTGEPVTVVKKVENIPVGHKAERLYFLHATHWGADNGAKIGAYVIHYADGTKEEIPIRYGMEVLDWWAFKERGSEVTNAEVAWTGSCEAAERNMVSIRLFMTTWKNPHPGVEIKSCDMITGDQPSHSLPNGQGSPAPFLVALSGQ